MPERHEQEARIADERHHRSAQHHQCHAAAPSDTAEIAKAGAKHQWQEGKARPEEPMHQQVRRHEADFQAMPCRDEAKRPEQRRAKAGRDPQQGCRRIRFSD